LQMNLDCIPCIITQVIEASQKHTKDRQILEQIIHKAAMELAEFDFARTPPELGGTMYHLVSRELGVADLYYEEKRSINKAAIAHLPSVRENIENSNDPFAAAIRFAIAGNIIDFGSPGGRKDDGINKVLLQVFEKKIAGEEEYGYIDELKRELHGAKKILYLTDNAGEIVLDRLLLEQLPKGKTTVVVRQGPIINDALLEDAKEVGLDSIAEVITSSVAMPGTPLSLCSREFREIFDSADLVISKGQGNFETLSDTDANIYFLLIAKCDVVASYLRCSVGDFIVTKSNTRR
jgi:uncharacterized protein with ATP-grasp and redox domains